MTHAERNAIISKKISAYTEKFTTSRAAARDALKREGLGDKPKAEKKPAPKAAAAAKAKGPPAKAEEPPVAEDTRSPMQKLVDKFK